MRACRGVGHRTAGLASPKLVLITNVLQPDMASALQAPGITVALVTAK